MYFALQNGAKKASPLEFLKLYSGHEILKLDVINTKNESHEIDAEIKLKGDLRVEGGRLLKKFTKD